MSASHIERVYDFYSGVYDGLYGRVFRSGRNMALDMLDLRPGVRLLEAGVGTGLSLPLFPAEVHVTGIDLSQKMLDRAKQRVERLGARNVQLRKMDASRMDFPDGAFDGVLGAYFISTVPDPVKVVREMKRVCRPGGYLVFVNHFLHEHPVVGAFDRMVSGLCYRLGGFYSDLQLDTLVREVGLTVDQVRPVPRIGYWKVVRCVNR